VKSTVLCTAGGLDDRSSAQSVKTAQSNVSHHPIATETHKPNPQSQSFSRGYGSILPTSLIYIVLSTRGYTPWRPDAVMSTTRGANKSRHRVFKGRRERTTNGKKSTVFPKSYTLSPVNPIPGCISMLRRKENSSGGSRWRPRFRLRYRSVSTSWCRNINLLPFR
jgi:hypothetical protein